MWSNWTGSESQDVALMDTSPYGLLDNGKLSTGEKATTPWFWFYLDDSGMWHKFEDDPKSSLTSQDIERYYNRNVTGVLQTQTSTGNTKIDFSAMMHTDIKTGSRRQIKRSKESGPGLRCFSSVPPFWEEVDPKLPYQVFCLKTDSPEYQSVAHYTENEGLLSHRQIKSICRIQNVDLWEFYSRKKIQLMRLKGVTDINEQRLFHGTDISNVHTICTYNFDCRLPAADRRVLGEGTYFAKHASCADNYSKWITKPVQMFGEAPQGFLEKWTKIIFLARVIVGKMTTGEETFMKPNHKSAINYHDSCVDDIKYPKVFAIFDSNQIYPEYLIQYC